MSTFDAAKKFMMTSTQPFLVMKNKDAPELTVAVRTEKGYTVWQCTIVAEETVSTDPTQPMPPFPT